MKEFMRLRERKVVSVGATSTSLLGENVNRAYVLIVNNSDTDHYIALNNTATTSDIPIKANGGSYELDMLNLYTGEISCINGVGAKNIFVLEMSYATS